MCFFHVGSFNAEYPLEVDDDFWENDNPQLAFVQPSDKPSTVITFNLWLRLTDFAASTLQSVVSSLFYVSSCTHSITGGYPRARWLFFWIARAGYSEQAERGPDGLGRDGPPTL
jgi:hypothetical protein